MTRRGTLWIGWTLALLCIALFARLGFWQYGRMHEKQALLARVSRALASPAPAPLSGDAFGVKPRWVAGEGRIEDATLFLDNQLRDGRQGVHVYCVLDVAGPDGRVLVDLGWLALPGNRAMPDVACPAGPLAVRGLLLDPPSTGLAMGDAMQPAGPRRWVMTRVDAAAIGRTTGFAVPHAVVRLDPKLPVGYARDLDVLPNTLPPERHLGYAVQWWALALAVLVTALLLTFRKAKPRA